MYEEKLIDVIETIVQNAVDNANYDKTIQCQIIECVDPTIGKYKVKYQDSSFLAYSGSSDVTYMPGASVYVLIPGNDMTRDKTILGTTKKLGANYVGGASEEEEKYEPVGNNCIDSSNEYSFSSYKNEVKVIYDRDNDVNELNLNLRSIETYIRKSSSVLCGGEFRTKLPVEQQFRGDFGIVFELSFLDNASQDTVTRNYVVDVNQMLGNPYKQTTWTRQYGIFNLDAVNFQHVSRIYLFVNNFPHQRDGEPIDIFMRELEFCGVTASSDTELNSYGLVFITPQGTYFDDNDLDSAKRKLQAQVRVKGKNVDNNSQDISYYWFVENVGVTINSSDYCNYGGQGWECKNQKNAVGTDENGNTIYEWVPADWEYVVTKFDSAAKETRYKCVAIYNDVILSKEITITNYSSDWEITVESDGGDQFYFDIGHPTLTCMVNGQLKNTDEFTYVWAEIDSSNNFTSLNPTLVENDEYNTAAADYAQLLADIEAERAMAAASQEKLDEYLTIMKKYDKIMRVEKIYLHDVQIRQIVNFSTYKCSVYYNGVYIGSGSIVLKNSLDGENPYTLIINNGTQVFKYDEMGISPVNTAINLKTVLLPLTFTLYDNLGEAIDIDVLRTCDIRWIVPDTNTLIEIPEAYGEPTSRDPEAGTATYENHLTAFSYLIARKYDISKTNNNIRLEIDYKDMTIIAKTNFTFIKEGEAGTNGTEFVAKIVPNVPGNIEAPVYPMILNGELNYTPREMDKWFRLQFWHNGEIIYDGTQSGITTEDKNINITWSILANKYRGESDNSDIEVVDKDAGTFRYLDYTNNSSPANIVKCAIKYENAEYYDTIPVITATAISGYKVGLKENTGFMYAIYSADSLRPQYDNAFPFEVIVTKMINGFEEDVSILTQEESVDYEWIPQGKVYDSKKWVYDEYLLETKDATEKNQYSCKPIDYYNGECVNIGLECKITKADAAVANIHIPIHFYLNRYGQNAINDWDGNSIDINESGNVILAPQVGAGQKEADNSFTGVLMGTVREATKTDKDVGLFGYNHGERSFFLNSEDGSAIFGYDNGQIIIDPSGGKGLLYSHNFWLNSVYDETGKPRSYNYQIEPNRWGSGENKQGMLIDLTTPGIKFGSGDFLVTDQGYLYAKGGGNIAGWKISDNSLSASSTGGSITINSNGSIQGGNSRGTWSINADGTASFTNIKATGGTVGGWTLSEDTIKGGNVTLNSSGNITGSGWYIENGGNAKFGNLYIYSDGRIEAPGFKISGDSISEMQALQAQINNLTTQVGNFQDQLTYKGDEVSTQKYADNKANSALSSAKKYADGLFKDGKDTSITVLTSVTIGASAKLTNYELNKLIGADISWTCINSITFTLSRTMQTMTFKNGLLTDGGSSTSSPYSVTMNVY